MPMYFAPLTRIAAVCTLTDVHCHPMPYKLGLYQLDGWDIPSIVLNTVHLRLLGTIGWGWPVLTSHSNFVPSMETYYDFRLCYSCRIRVSFKILLLFTLGNQFICVHR